MEKLQGPIGNVIKDSLKTKKVEGVGNADCVDFSFDIKLLKVEGKICKNGLLDVRILIFGVEIYHYHVDLSSGKVCWKFGAGIEEIQLCFYLKGNCLWTSGYIDGWLHPKVEWDQQVVCL